MKSIDLDVGDHVTTNGLDVQVVAHRRITPDSKSGISFRLLPSGDILDAASVRHVGGYSHREIMLSHPEATPW